MDQPVTSPAKNWTAEDLKRRCRYYAIPNAADSLWMFEYDLGNGRRLDVLTVDIRNLYVRGFEVKTSRADFTADKKWRDYLPFVNEFFFCAPKGVIAREDLPPDVGLLEADGDWLGCTKKARQLQPPFVRETYTEIWMTKLLTGFVRNLQWREERLSGWCQCGKKFEIDRDGRTGGPRGQEVSL